jgi:hypothetical protein
MNFEQINLFYAAKPRLQSVPFVVCKFRLFVDDDLLGKLEMGIPKIAFPGRDYLSGR